MGSNSLLDQEEPFLFRVLDQKLTKSSQFPELYCACKTESVVFLFPTTKMDTIPKLFWKRLEKMSLDEEWISRFIKLFDFS